MFNLLEEPWIPCLSPAGDVREVGIRDALLNAGDYAELRDPSPLVTAALHRLLLSVLHSAIEGPKNLDEWIGFWKAGRFPSSRIAAYLDKWQNRFDLFDEKHPFYQVGHLSIRKRQNGEATGESDVHPATELIQELSKGNNATLFDHTHRGITTPLEPSQCARWLVANQAFSVDGNPNPPYSNLGQHPAQSAAPLAGGVVALLRGESLFATLMLNLLTYNKDQPFQPANGLHNDRPSWERDDPPAISKSRPCLGYLDLLTWQSRCVRLLRDADGLVRRMLYAPAAGPDDSSYPGDPMWFKRYNPKPDKEFAIRLEPDRALWRSSDSLFVFSVRPDKGRETRPRAFSQTFTLQRDFNLLGSKDAWRCSLLGIANDKAKVLLWAHEQLPVPVRLLRNEQAVNALSHGLRSSEEAGRGLRWALTMLGGKLIAFDPTNSGRNAKREEAEKKADSLQGLPHYWAELELPFKKFLMDLGEASDTDGPVAEWHKMIRHTALTAFHQAADNSLGRSAREMKARVEAEHELNKGLKRIGLGADALREEVEHG